MRAIRYQPWGVDASYRFRWMARIAGFIYWMKRGDKVQAIAELTRTYNKAESDLHHLLQLAEPLRRQLYTVSANESYFGEEPGTLKEFLYQVNRIKR